MDVRRTVRVIVDERRCGSDGGSVVGSAGHASDRDELKKSCKPWELFGCTMQGPGCGEKKCDVEKTLGFCMPVCKFGCWCRGNLYRRKRDNKCVPKHECLL
uniref:TIL domain containing protein n=1 Tax=Rhipicephalus zambeziensis TaxID=60191 RepID=A0A224YL35_9ACAR